MSQPAHYVPVGFLLSRINANFFCVNVWKSKKELYICYVNNDKQTHNDMKHIINPIEAAVQTKSTGTIMDCLAIFEKKGTFELSPEEFQVEGYMLQELTKRGFAKWVDAYVERM